MKKIVSLFLALAMMLSLAACSGGTKDTTSQGSNESAQTEQTTTEPSEPVEITWWSNLGQTNADYLQVVIDAFNESQDKYHVTFVYQGNANELLAKLQATNLQDLPALFSGPVENVALYSSSDFCMPLQSYIDNDPNGWPELEDTWEALRTGYCDNEGNQIGYPIGYSYGGIFYNADLVKAAGVDPASLQSFDDLYDACVKIVSGGYAPCGMGLNNGGWWFNAALGREGLMAYNNNNGFGSERITECLYTDDPDVYNAIYNMLAVYQKMHAENLVIPYGTDFQGEVIPAFASGQCVLMNGLASHTTKILNAVDGAFEVGMVPMVSCTENGLRTGEPCGGTGTWIGNNGDEVQMQGAYEFIKFASSAEWATFFAVKTGYLAPHKQSYESAEYQEFLNNKFPCYKDIYDSLAASDGSATNPFVPIGTEMKSANNLAIATVSSDPKADIETTIKTAEDTLQEAIDLYNLSNP